VKRIVEKMRGVVSLVPMNLFMADIVDMQELEDWEERLEALGEDYAVTFKKKRGKIFYDIFVNTKKPKSSFQI
jgi:hypothetical protein